MQWRIQKFAKGGSICVLSRRDFKYALIFIGYVIISDVTVDKYVRTSTQKYNNQSTLVAHFKLLQMFAPLTVYLHQAQVTQSISNHC